MAGNHFARLGISGCGVHYWNARDFSEQAFHAEVGYRYRNSRLEWGFLLFVKQNRLGNNRYTANTGIALDYSRRLNENGAAPNLSSMVANNTMTNIWQNVTTVKRFR